MKFTPQQIELLVKTRDEIRDLTEKQHKSYDILIKELNARKKQGLLLFVEHMDILWI